MLPWLECLLHNQLSLGGMGICMIYYNDINIKWTHTYSTRMLLMNTVMLNCSLQKYKIKQILTKINLYEWLIWLQKYKFERNKNVTAVLTCQTILKLLIHKCMENWRHICSWATSPIILGWCQLEVKDIWQWIHECRGCHWKFMNESTRLWNINPWNINPFRFLII